jgi:outer membrane protein OmpA-like peptidoglycan-associated protein
VALGVDGILVRTAVEELLIRPMLGGSRPRGEDLALAREAARVLRSELEAPSPEFLALAVQLARFPDSVSSPPRRISPSLGFEASLRDLAAVLEDALLSGRLVVTRRRVESLAERRQLPFPKLPPLPRARPEPGTHSFEVRFVDEIGRAISGVDAEFVADGPQTRATNAAGIALLDGVNAAQANVAILDVEALAKVLDPRWENFRPGKPPRESNQQEVVFRSSAIGPFNVKAELPNTVVIKPPLGKLFVELFDKTGRTRHAKRTFEIKGPQTFQGETDEEGRLLQEQVFPGDYALSLALDFFENDPDRVIDIVESPLVVLPAGAAAPQVRMVGAVPRSLLARLQFFFNTNKAFLLPTALPSVKKLRRLYEENAPCKLLVVGHADTTAGPAYNDKLSLERAKATIAYLQDDVDAWLAFYGDDVDGKKRWGRVEDRLMIISMPDFTEKPKGEDAVRWYQSTRGLEVDGVAGKKTRGALIEEYMSLDGASLADFVGEIDAVAHGCGENFPLDDTGEELDQAPADAKRDPIDRRVELFFFDAEFGITPAPPGSNSKAGSPEYPLWRERVVEVVELQAGDPDAPKVIFVELADAHFRTNSAVVLPEGENPDAKGEHESLTSVGLIAQALRFSDEHPGRKLLVAGHTDSAGGDAMNDELSKQRAELALALLLGDRDSFKSLANQRHVAADINQVLSWVSRAFTGLTFNCDPGPITDRVSSDKVRAFQRDFNRNKSALGSTSADLTVDGSVGELTWGAFFDCYEFALLQELGEDAAGLAALRGKLVFADDGRKALGFGEHFPIEELGVDNFRSQTNRRVEILFFESGEEPDLAHAENDPETSELYLPGEYVRSGLAATVTALRVRVRVRLLDADDAPFIGTAWTIVHAAGTTEGVTAADGVVDATVAATDSSVLLKLPVGEITLDLADIPPASTILGAQHRLNNLDYDVGTPSGVLDPATQTALSDYQTDHKLPVTGQLDPATSTSLQAIFGA